MNWLRKHEGAILAIWAVVMILWGPIWLAWLAVLVGGIMFFLWMLKREDAKEQKW